MAGYLKEGKLTKRGTGYPYTWRERQFGLTSNALSYATVDGVGKGSFALSRTTVVTALSQGEMPGKKSPFGFKVSTGVDDLYLFASSDQERSEWIAAIISALGSAPATTAGVSTNYTRPATTPTAPTPSSSEVPVSSETRLEELNRRISEQERRVTNRRAARAAQREKERSAAVAQDLSMFAEENKEMMSLARVLAESKVNEDVVRHADLKRREKSVSTAKEKLGAHSKPEERTQVETDEESFKEEWNSLCAKAVELANKHADDEYAYNDAKRLAQRALEDAEVFEERAQKKRQEATALATAEAKAKVAYETSAMLVNAQWTQDFQDQIQKSLSAKSRPLPASSPRREEYAKQGHSSSFVNIMSGDVDGEDADFDCEVRRKVDKKLGTDHNFYERYIWINDDTGCFHWSKSAKEGSSSKNVHIKTCVKTVVLRRPPKGNAWMGFTLQFFPKLDTGALANARGVSVKDGTIDIKVTGEDATRYVECMCRKVIGIIKGGEMQGATSPVR